MQNNLNIRGEQIQSVYTNYKQGKYIVNRRYQRKLVWTLFEKQRFIDSLLSQYPVPLFLGVSFEHPTKGTCFEILDGMQRLEAITSFIEGDFPVQGQYFDLTIVAETNRLVSEGQLIQNKPKLDFDSCKKILNYPLPISTSSYTSSKNVDETFRRINTGGVRLSRQEVRQAGSVSEFPQLVRKCSTYIRGDVSHTDIVDLDKMRSISLTKDDLNYGIKIKDTFWNKNHILVVDNILASRDEELVAHILLHIVLKDYAQTWSKFLDDVYDEKTEAYVKANDGVVKYGSDILYKQFCFVYDELCNTINEFESNFAQHLYLGAPNKVQNAYQVIFLAFFELLMRQNKQIQNYKSLARILKGTASQCMGTLNSDSKWHARDRIQMTKAVCGIVSSQFIPREGVDPTAQSWVENLENILNQSRTENVCYDFKIGLYPLVGEGGFNDKLVSKIVKTLTAMANSHAGDNYVILGVADSEADYNKHYAKYGSEARKYNSFYVTGIGAEAAKYHGSIDAYQQKIQQSLDVEPVDDSTKRLIQRQVIFLKYYDKDIVLLKITRGSQPIKYDGKIYTRKVANIDPIPIASESEFDFYKEFIEQSSRYPYNLEDGGA